MDHQGRMRRRANVAVMVAIALPVLVGAAALTVDVGVMAVAKSQLQCAADAAALAGVVMLQTSLDPAVAREAALETAASNVVVGNPLTLDPNVDVVCGAYMAETKEIIPFDESSGVVAVPDGPVALRVTARRTTGSPDGPVALHFARALGLEQVEMTAVATAGLTISKKARPCVEAVIVQDQSGSFEDEFAQAREANVEFLNFMTQCFTEGDSTGIVGFGYHPNHQNTSSPTRRDTNVFHNYPLHTNEDTDGGVTVLQDYIAAMPTVVYYKTPEGHCYTNLYTGLLRATLAFVDPTAAETAWNSFLASLYNGSTFYNIGYWQRNNPAALRTKMAPLFQMGFRNPDAEHVVILVSDGMPWYHQNNFPDTYSQQLCRYIADQMALAGIRIHTVSLCQNDRPGDGSMGSDAAFTASLCRNGGYPFYTYDAVKLSSLLVGVGQVEVGQAKLIE